MDKFIIPDGDIGTVGAGGAVIILAGDTQVAS